MRHNRKTGQYVSGGLETESLNSSHIGALLVRMFIFYYIYIYILFFLFLGGGGGIVV